MKIAVILLSIFLAFAVWMLYIQLVKVGKLVALLEVYLRLISVTAVRTNKAYKRIKEADRLGAFEADDEVGYTFQEIKQTVEELNSFLEKYVNNDKAQEK